MKIRKGIYKLRPEGLKAHPLSLMLPYEDVGELRDHMREHGQKIPVVMLEGMVLDGNRRRIAAIANSMMLMCRDFGSLGTDGSDALEFAWSGYFGRGLSYAQRETAMRIRAKLKKEK